MTGSRSRQEEKGEAIRLFTHKKSVAFVKPAEISSSFKKILVASEGELF